MVPESKLTPQSLAQQVETVFMQPDAARQMAHAALSTGKPDAAEHLADLVEDLAQRKGRPG